MEQVRNEQTIYSAAVYCRLSKDDDQAGESVSIETQKMMLTDYCHERGFSIYETYENHTYTYGNTSWADLLTAFDGYGIAYEGQTYNSSTGTVSGTAKSGNPICYYNGTRWDLTWTDGRRLASADNENAHIVYTYDLNGIRTSKTVGTKTYSYLYASGKLLQQTDGTNTWNFAYAANGNPFSLTYNGTTYYYITNQMGDVMYLVNATGTRVAAYTYDPYGKVLTATGTMASINPLRYRGYYYDTETGFYYLQSRYYDPQICRFINADSYASTGQGIQGYNMFTYCANNPVTNADPTGYMLGKICTVTMCDGGTDKFIDNQHSEEYNNIRLGGSTVGHGGCGPVAVFNALQILGRYNISFDDIVEYYNNNNKLLLSGWLGSLPYACIDILEDMGYTVIATKDVIGAAEYVMYADASILWYWFDTDSFPYVGAHFVAFKQYGDTGYYYNVFSDSTAPCIFEGTCYDFLVSRDRSAPVLIMIFDD